VRRSPEGRTIRSAFADAIRFAHFKGGAMTANEFRRLALDLPETAQGGHMGHADFRVGGKIFATLGYPSEGWGMVKLTPVQQQLLVQAEPEIFVPAKGAWGARGATSVRLRTARKRSVREALVSAWNNTAPKAPVKRKRGSAHFDPPDSPPYNRESVT